jgi:hypothetical protein
MRLALIHLDDGVHQPGIRACQIGRTNRDHRLHGAILAGEPALLGEHGRQRIGDVGE